MPQENWGRGPSVILFEKSGGFIESDVRNVFQWESDAVEVRGGRVSRRRKWAKVLGKY